MKPTAAKFSCSISGLTPGETYRFVVDGLTQAQFTSGSAGKQKLKFQATPSGALSSLDFDPRGKLISVIDSNTNTILHVIFDGDGEPATTSALESTALHPTSLAPGGFGSAVFSTKAGQSEFEVAVEDIPVGDYELFVDRLPRGTMTADATGHSDIKYHTSPSGSELLLDFDPRHKGIDVLQGTNVFLTTVLTAATPGVNACTPSAVELALTSSGLDTNATAKATARVRDNCEHEFEVETENLPDGDYDLYVDSALRGVITVSSGTGNIEFSTQPEAGEEQLAFDPAGKLIEIEKNGDIYLSRVFPN